MHSHLEIVMPPTDDVAARVAQIMAPLDENYKDEEGNESRHGFWDFFVIGGRFAGSKAQAKYHEEKMAAFNAPLKERNVTVSGLTCGKQTLQPASQIPMVDALWQEHFPESGLAVCPLFSHSNDQYDSADTLAGDVCTLAEMPHGLTAERVIIAGPHWRDSETVEGKHMEQEAFWNGMNHVDSSWDGTVASAIARFAERIKTYKPEYREKALPREGWLVVTVDYHS